MKNKWMILFSCLLALFVVFASLEPCKEVYAAKKSKYIRMNVKSVTLSRGSEYKLRLYNTKKRQTIVFSSDNENVATVASTTALPKQAVVTAVNPGNTTIRATISNKSKVVRTLKVKVKVTPYAVSIKFGQKKISLAENKNMKLNTIIKPNVSQEIPLYESSDTDIVTVNSRGVITGIKAGEATVTATLLSTGQSASCTILVTAPQEENSRPTSSVTTAHTSN